MRQIFDWLDERTGYRKARTEALDEPIPGGSRWAYVWGSTLVYTFVLQVITGVFLWTAYSPSSQSAWESVYYIQYEMYAGSLVRGIHHYAAQAMTVLLVFHFLQIVIHKAYLAPREVNYWLGLVLMLIVFGLGLTGYLLPWDQKGYYATKVATNIMAATPAVGPEVQTLVQGGAKYGNHTLTRFFALHVGILPGLLVAFLALHLAVFRRHGVKVPDPHRRPDSTFWPDQVLKDAIACALVLGIVIALAVYRPAELSAPADPAEAYSAARPEWYFLFLFRFLKFESIDELGLAFGAIYVPGILMTYLFAMPFIAKVKGGHKFNLVVIGGLTVGIAALTGLAMYEDANSEEFKVAVESAHRDAERIKELAAAPTGIPTAGAVTLLRADPLTQGPRLYSKNCAACHHYDGHNGLGEEITQVIDGETVPVDPSAADLGQFGTREWMTDVLVKYDEVFAPIANNSWYDPEEGIYLHGEMAAFSEENGESLLENEDALKAIVEFMVAQGDVVPKETLDADLIARGRNIYTGEDDDYSFPDFSSCSDCHAMSVTEEDGTITELSGGAGEGYVDLTGYASQKWLRAFIANPADERFYGEDKNHMPIYEKSLTEKQLSLIVKWMTGDYYQPEKIEEAVEEEKPVQPAE